MNTIRLGSTGPDVATWQRVVGTTSDGIFGPITERATKAWQTAHGLVADGVVGAKSWAAASVTAPAASRMVAERASYGARGVDSLPFSMGGTAEQALALAATGIDFFVGYLGSMNTARLDYVLDAGLAFNPVTKANEFYDGPQDEIAQLKALQIPKGVTVWLDIEGQRIWDHGKQDAGAVMQLLRDWATPINDEGWEAGIYVGAPQPLTGEELFALPFKRYWLGIGHCVDRFQKDAYPRCGWCQRQDWHNEGNGHLWRGTGVLVDTNAVQADHFGRMPTWVRRV